MPQKPIRSHEEAREGFKKAGLTIRQWSKDNGFNERLVYAVLSGANKGYYGKAHLIAVRLGLKESD